MFKSLALCGLMALVAACSGDRGAASPRARAAAVTSAGGGEQVTILAAPPVPEEAEPIAVADAASIAGQWDVASFEGYRPRRLSGTIRASFADFGERGVALRIECNYSGRAGTIHEGRFTASHSNDRAQTAMSCGPEGNARESRFFSFFEQGPTVQRLGPDRLRLRADAAELILERPALRRLEFVPTPAELQGRWRLLEVSRYLPGGGFSGIGLSEVPGRIVISGDHIFYSRCPQYALTFRFSADGKLEKTDGTAPPAAPVDCRALAEPAPGRELPSQWDVFRLLHASPMVEKAGEDALLISNEHLGLLITKAPCKSIEQSDDHRTSRAVDCASPE